MATGRGNDRERRTGSAPRPAAGEEAESGGRLPAIPELARRLLSVGLSGFFLTEETVRKALGDTLPKDWVDFAVEQSERTRREFLERLSFELGRTLENVDFAGILKELLEGRTLEVKAEIRLGAKEPGGRSAKMHVASGRDAKK